MGEIKVESKWIVTTLVTIIIAIIFGLTGVVYNGVAQDIKEGKEAIKELDQKKVNNDMLKVLIEQLVKSQNDTAQQIKGLLEEIKVIKEKKIRIPDEYDDNIPVE